MSLSRIKTDTFTIDIQRELDSAHWMNEVESHDSTVISSEGRDSFVVSGEVNS